MSFNGKNLTKPTWPGRQVTSCIRRLRISFFIFMIEVIDPTSLLIKRLNREKSKENQMVTRNSINLIAWHKAAKSVGLFSVIKNIEDTSIKSGDWISWVNKLERKFSQEALTNSIFGLQEPVDMKVQAIN